MGDRTPSLGADTAPLPCARGLFDIPDDIAYFNIASLAPSLRPGQEAGVASVRGVDHHILMELVTERIKDRKVLRLVSGFLRADVVELHGELAETLTGTPQGGVASRLLANIHLSVLDRHFAQIWDTKMTWDSV